jgi:hypothetical protein
MQSHTVNLVRPAESQLSQREGRACICATRADKMPAMATVELSVEQLREALLQLPEPQRRKLLEELTRLPGARYARSVARQARGTVRMTARQRKRMSELLAKGNAGTLTPGESREIDALVDEFERKTLAMARRLVRPANS